jgi:DNA-binding SARP family transcriptional activator
MSWVFRVLGPLDVGGPVGAPSFTSARERTILAMLLLEANRAVSVDRLVDAVWDESPPHTARGQIQICVSRLRRTLADAGLPDRIVTRPPGYLLWVEEGEFDLHAFDRFVTTGRQAAHEHRAAESAEALRAALDMFAGVPLGDVDSRIVQSVVRRILDRKMIATEECIEAELAIGAHQEVIGELTELVRENPLRERLLALQMAALHRAGRPGEALAVYQEARRTLINELGVEPGNVLRALQMKILNDEDDDGQTSPTSPGGRRKWGG